MRFTNQLNRFDLEALRSMVRGLLPKEIKALDIGQEPLAGVPGKFKVIIIFLADQDVATKEFESGDSSSS